MAKKAIQVRFTIILRDDSLLMCHTLLARLGVLNQWLRNNGGYTENNGLYEEVIYKIAPDRIQYVGPFYGNTSLSPAKLKSMLDNHVIVIANVMNGGHFVLMIGYDEGNTNW